MKDCNKKLKAKIIENYSSQKEFAKDMELSACSVNLRLNNQVAWKSDEIGRACQLLNIPQEEAFIYFF